VVVVLDRSGSMGGWKMVAARRAAARIIDSLAARDRFAVLAFDSVTERPPGLSSLSPATDRARWAAIEWLARLEARGGTEMLEPLRTAVTLLAGTGEGADTDEGGRDRFLILVTDGQVGAEDQILAAVAPQAARTRIFTLGIDQAVNAGFLRRLAAAGAGRCELVESEERLDEVMTSLHRRISPPLVTGLRVESGTTACELTASQIAPAHDPDLFPGAPCMLSGRWLAAAPPAEITLTVVGDGGFREQITVPAVQPDRAVRTCWARALVRDLEDRYTVGGGDPSLADQIVAMSLRHRVLSRFTAFVAVDRTRHVVIGGHELPVVQPVELPRGWAAGAGLVLGSRVPRGGGAVLRPSSAGIASAPMGGGQTPASGKRKKAPGPRPSGPSIPVYEEPRRDDGVPAAYAVRAEELFARIEDCLARGVDCGVAAAPVEELADDLASVGADVRVVRVLRRLAAALRASRSLEAELAAARKVFADTPMVPPVGSEREARRNWWRNPGR
jgi:Ca-activated chloride channel family protein